MIVYRFDNVEPEIEQVWKLPSFSLNKQWDGTSAKSSLRCIVAETPTLIHFLVRFPLDTWDFADGRTGDFREGLWERDVAELFVAQGSKYYEINLSPSGMWWIQSFKDIREREPGFKIDTGLANIIVTPSSSDNAVSFSLLKSPMFGDLAQVSGNVTACIGRDRREFLSLAKLSKRDFHQPKSFLPFVSINASFIK